MSSNKTEVTKLLSLAGMLTPQNQEAIARHSSPADFTYSIEVLHNFKILTQLHFDTTFRHPKPTTLAHRLGLLSEAGLLTLENIDRVSSDARPSDFTPTIIYLSQTNLLTLENFNAIVEHKQADCVAKILGLLSIAHILTPENREFVKTTHINTYDLFKVLQSLVLAGILNQQNFDHLHSHRYFYNFYSTIHLLHTKKLLNQDNYNTVYTFPHVFEFEEAIHLLIENNMLNQVTFDTLTSHQSFSELFHAMELLNSAEILNPIYYDIIVRLSNPFVIAEAFQFLSQSSLLTPENIRIVVAHPQPNYLAKVFTILHQANLLTAENKAAVLAHAPASHLMHPLFSLFQANILNQNNFNALLSPEAAILLTPQIIQFMWARINPHFIEIHFQNILIAAQETNQITRFITLVNRILLGDEHHQEQPALNPGQSTHESSVHQSVAESATCLMRFYGYQLSDQIDTLITQMTTLLIAVGPDSIKKAAAIRCIKRIGAFDYSFVEPISNISTRELLALIYLAIHDEHRRYAKLNDTIEQFIQGLYEVQRGYNLNAGNQDNGKKDRPICPSGTFNKLINSLEGTHPDFKVNSITYALASTKFPIVVKEKAKAYLFSLASPATSADFRSFTQLMFLCEREGIEAISEHIKDAVTHHFFDEFGILFQNNPEHPKYQALLSSIEYIQLDNLKEFQEQLSQSRGYRKYCSAILKQESLFSLSSNTPNLETQGVLRLL